mgnify:CR=1 FL=1
MPDIKKSLKKVGKKVSGAIPRDVKNVGKGFATPIRGIRSTKKTLNKVRTSY